MKKVTNKRITLRKVMWIYFITLMLGLGIGLLMPFIDRWLGDMVSKRVAKSVKLMASCLVLYINDHKGQFPNSEKQLIDEGYLISKDGGFRVKIIYGIDWENGVVIPKIGAKNECGYRNIKSIYFPPYVRYGTKYGDLMVRDGKLYDKKQEIPVYLIDTTYCPEALLDKVSDLIYEQMKTASQKR